MPDRVRAGWRAGAVILLAGELACPAAAGPASVPGVRFEDGAAGAASGIAQLPRLLDGYAARPPWSVAGVDYAVGVPAGTALKDPASLAMAGVRVDAATHTVRVSGDHVRLNGYDFSLEGGWNVYVDGADDVIEDSNFKVGVNNRVPIQGSARASDLSVRHNTLDGGGGRDGAVWALISYNGSGKFVARYNYFLNAPEDAIDFNNGTMSTVVEYNLFHNLGTDPRSHPDPVQYVGVRLIGAVEAFNTIYQPNPGGMQGVQLQAQLGSSLSHAAIRNNVIVAKGPSRGMSYSIAVIQDPGNAIDGVVVQGNHIDFSGAYGPFYPPSGSGLAFVNNVSMVSGAVIPAPPGTAATNVTRVTAGPGSDKGGAGGGVTLTVNLNTPAMVRGAPTLSLQDGGLAIYAGGSGSNVLTFNCAAGTLAPRLAITRVNLPAGATITDAAGNTLDLCGALGPVAVGAQPGRG